MYVCMCENWFLTMLKQLRIGNSQSRHRWFSSLNRVECKVHLRQLVETQAHVSRLVLKSLFNLKTNAAILILTPILFILVLVSSILVLGSLHCS